MSKTISIDKIKKELAKGTPDEQYDAYLQVKDFVQQNIEAEQKALEDKASELQSKINRINGE